MLKSAEKRFGYQLPATPVQWLSNYGSTYTAEQSRLFARQSDLQPVTLLYLQSAEQRYG
jgi:putative transposase